MYILQLNSLLAIPESSIQEEQLTAVLRSESPDVLSAVVENCLNFAFDGKTIKFYKEVLPNGVVLTKAFKRGSALEYYAFPKDRELMIVDLGTMQNRIEDLVSELRKQVTHEWEGILTGVTEVKDLEAAVSLLSV